jgi:AraC-like DNA-binding protein
MRVTRRSPHSDSFPPDLFRQFEQARHEYRSRFKLDLLFVGQDGKLLCGKPPKTGGATEKERCQWRALAVSEALRWGQPSMIACPGDHMIWGVPVMHNSKILGGLVVKPCEVKIEEESAKILSETLNHACDHLLEIAEKYNLTNGSHLKLNRIAAFVEREKAEAIHESKQKNHSDLQQLYHLEEPSLLYAIQQGQRNQARAIINRLLLHIYNHKPGNLNFLKSFALELVVMMSRTAVEAGADPARIMAMNSGHFSTLTGIDDEEELSPWLTDTLGRLMDEIQAQRRRKSQVRLSRAIGYIKKHLAENIRRDVVARKSGLSPGHFSHLVSDETGRTFRELVATYRVRHACHLLAHTRRSLSEIALDCGFADQSYFTKIFRKISGKNPLQYRKSLGGPAMVEPSETR